MCREVRAPHGWKAARLFVMRGVCRLEWGTTLTARMPQAFPRMMLALMPPNPKALFIA